MGLYVGGAILLAILLFWALTWGRVVRALNSNQHFQEVAAKVPALKRAALETPVLAEHDVTLPPEEAMNFPGALFLGWYRFGEATRVPDDVRRLQTTAGLTVTYAVILDGVKYDHHLWVGLPAASRGAAAMGRQMDQVLFTFTCFICRILGVEKWSLQPRLHPNVHHVVFTLDREEHENLARRPVLDPSPGWLKTFHRQLVRASW